MRVKGFSLALLLLIPQYRQYAQVCHAEAEPNVEIAKEWWCEQKNVWTPISWKDHYFKFNVFYNGILLAEPAPGFSPRPHSRPWIGQNFQLTFRAAPDGLPRPFPKERQTMWKIDGGQGIQGWNKEHETPVLWTEYRCQEGIVLKSEVFAHITDNKDIESALEPLYAWVRLSVEYVEPIRHPDSYQMSVMLTRSCLVHAEYLEYAVTIDVDPGLAPYKEGLSAESYTENGLEGYYITESDGKVRMIVLPSQEKKTSFDELSDGIYNLRVSFDAKVGDHVDLLVPMLPVDREEIDREKSLTYDGALTMSDWYWDQKTSTAGTFHVPEPFFNEALAQSVKFAPIIAEKDYETGEYSYLTGTWAYDALWTTPTSMVSHMFLDQLGYFDMTEKYSEVFYKNQGTVHPPGDAFEMHPGYFSTHKLLTSIDWLTDHGAVMLQLATHGLLTGNKAFIDHWTGPLEKACDFIVDASAAKGHGGIEGLLPPAVATDDMIPIQAVWNIAWNYKGMFETVRLFEKIGHPKAAEYRVFLNDFKDTFVKEYRRIAEDGARWTDKQGRSRYKPSTVMTNEPMKYHLYNDAFYLDTGPLALVWAGLMEADDPIMEDLVDFFKEGPDLRLWEPMFHAVDRAILIHEISSCEPCYSWNIFHSWKKGDRHKFLEGMYSILVGAISQNTFISCEHRSGIQGNLFAFPVAFYLAKLSVIDDQISQGDLHLLRLCPKAWIRTDDECRFEQIPTEFGPVNMKFHLTDDAKTLLLSFSGKWREKPGHLVLHVPQLPGLENIVVNGKDYGLPQTINLEP
ncbi:MAG: hypothetical protein HUJ90_06235 [Bacteroidales bacterium]|nr:hypothetical protein [Bacteroidales bacterium]